MYKKSEEMLSPKQVESFLRRARQAFKNSGFINGSPKNTSNDFGILGLYAHDDFMATIEAVLAEIRPQDYTGPHPPHQKSGEPKVKGATMLQFVWSSTCFKGKKMCFKFCMADRERLAVLRIHEAHNPNVYEG